jgi:hypothetical protein
MASRPLIALVLLTLATIPASAHSGHNYGRLWIGPTTLDLTLAGLSGATPCDPSASSAVFLLDCTTAGPGAIIAVSDLDDTTPLDFAYGTCTVIPGSPNTANVVADSSYSYRCGVDRDDDGFLTNVDTSCGPAALPGTCSRDPDGFDDDSEYGSVNAVAPPWQAQIGSTINVCFRRDNAEGGFDWDDVAVYIALNAPYYETPVAAGFFTVGLSLTDATACQAGQIVSGHTHVDFIY